MIEWLLMERITDWGAHKREGKRNLNNRDAHAYFSNRGWRGTRDPLALFAQSAYQLQEHVHSRWFMTITSYVISCRFYLSFVEGLECVGCCVLCFLHSSSSSSSSSLSPPSPSPPALFSRFSLFMHLSMLLESTSVTAVVILFRCSLDWKSRARKREREEKRDEHVHSLFANIKRRLLIILPSSSFLLLSLFLSRRWKDILVKNNLDITWEREKRPHHIVCKHIEIDIYIYIRFSLYFCFCAACISVFFFIFFLSFPSSSSSLVLFQII